MQLNNNIVNQVIEALVKTLNLPISERVVPSTKLKEDLGLDSMSSLTFLIALEDMISDFSINPDTLDTNHLETVQSVVDYVTQEIMKKSSAY